MLTTLAHFSSMLTEATNAAWQRTKEKSGPTPALVTCGPAVFLSIFLYINSLHPSPYGMVSMETEAVQKKGKLYQE